MCHEVLWRMGAAYMVGPVRAFCTAMSDSKNSPVIPAATENRQFKRAAGFVEDAYARIRGDIMSLKIPPNTRISVDSLVREFGISQTPIREALSMLEAHGLVTK